MDDYAFFIPPSSRDIYFLIANQEDLNTLLTALFDKVLFEDKSFFILLNSYVIIEVKKRLSPYGSRLR